MVVEEELEVEAVEEGVEEVSISDDEYPSVDGGVVDGVHADSVRRKAAERRMDVRIVREKTNRRCKLYREEWGTSSCDL